MSLGKCVCSGLMTEGAPERKYLQERQRLAGCRLGIVAGPASLPYTWGSVLQAIRKLQDMTGKPSVSWDLAGDCELPWVGVQAKVFMYEMCKRVKPATLLGRRIMGSKRACVCVCVCMYVHTCMCACVCAHVCACTCVHDCSSVCVHVHAYTHMCTCKSRQAPGQVQAGGSRGRQEGNRQGRLLTHTVMLRSGHWSPKVPPCSLKVMRFQTAMTVSSGMWKWKSSMLAKERKGLSLRGVRVK